jgi:hypothetical protein
MPRAERQMPRAERDLNTCPISPGSTKFDLNLAEATRDIRYITGQPKIAVRQVSETFPVVVVTGPRQMGNPTMLKRRAGRERGQVSLNAPLNREMTRKDPELFYNAIPPLPPCLSASSNMQKSRCSS